MPRTYLTVDASEVFALANKLGKNLSAERFDALMRRSLNETGKRSKKIIRTAIQKEYYAPDAFVNKAIHTPIISGGGGSVECRIPLIGEKGKIGGTFSASGGVYGWNPPPYNVQSNIVKAKTSTMPGAMRSYGGQPPFRNIGERTMRKDGKGLLKKPKTERASRAGGLTWTRAGKSRLPIMPVAGLAVPQMMLNRSAEETEEKIVSLAEKRVLHNFSGIFG